MSHCSMMENGIIKSMYYKLFLCEAIGTQYLFHLDRLRSSIYTKSSRKMAVHNKDMYK